MADTKASLETAASTLTGTEIVRIVQGGASVRTTASAIAALASSGSGSNLVDLKLDFAGAIDNSTDDLTHVNNALANPHVELFVQEGTALVSAEPTNKYGPKIGPGRILKAVTNGHQQLNLQGDQEALWFGSEYLTVIRDKFIAHDQTTKITFAGDSTTAGTGISNAAYQIQALVQQLCRDKGFDFIPVNNGHSGITTEQWRTTYLATDMATAPHCLVIRYGINDPSVRRDGTATSTDTWETDQANRVDITDYSTTIRSALTTIRASKDVTQMSIILMMPNSTSDSPNGRDEKWYEVLSRTMRKVAREFQCGFIDTYRVLQDSRYAGAQYDNAFGDGRHIHPNDKQNILIASLIADFMIPSGLQMRNVDSNFRAPAITDLPQTYPLGWSSYTISWTVCGTAIVGTVRTYLHCNGGITQEVVPFGNNGRPAKRQGTLSGNAWYAWKSAPQVQLALLNSWTTDGSSTWGWFLDLHDGIVTVTGRIKGGTTTAGTSIATLPSWALPPHPAYGSVRCGASLITSATIATDAGTSTLFCADVSSNTFLDACGMSWAI